MHPNSIRSSESHKPKRDPPPRGTHVLQVAEDEVLSAALRTERLSGTARDPQGLSYPPLPVGPAPQTPPQPRPSAEGYDGLHHHLLHLLALPAVRHGCSRPAAATRSRRHTLRRKSQRAPEAAEQGGSAQGMLEDSPDAAALGKPEDRVSTAPAAHG